MLLPISRAYAPKIEMSEMNEIQASDGVGLLGLGAMGRGVARNLLRHGFAVYGFDVCADVVAAMAKEGVIGCGNAAAVGRRCRTVIVLVVNADQTESVLLGPDGAAPAMSPGSVVVVASTVAPDFAVHLAAKLAHKDILMLDAPVTGGVSGAAGRCDYHRNATWSGPGAQATSIPERGRRHDFGY
jgi:putative dehydrogenase